MSVWFEKTCQLKFHFPAIFTSVYRHFYFLFYRNSKINRLVLHISAWNLESSYKFVKTASLKAILLLMFLRIVFFYCKIFVSEKNLSRFHFSFSRMTLSVIRSISPPPLVLEGEIFSKVENFLCVEWMLLLKWLNCKEGAVKN